MACQCTRGKSPAFLAQAEMLTDAALELYAQLVSPNWTSDDCDPDELIEAVDAIQQHWGNHPSGDYAEAIDWCAFIVSERALERDGLVAADLTQRETDAELANTRSEDDAHAEDAHDLERDTAREERGQS